MALPSHRRQVLNISIALVNTALWIYSNSLIRLVSVACFLVRSEADSSKDARPSYRRRPASPSLASASLVGSLGQFHPDICLAMAGNLAAMPIINLPADVPSFKVI